MTCSVAWQVVQRGAGGCAVGDWLTLSAAHALTMATAAAPARVPNACGRISARCPTSRSTACWRRDGAPPRTSSTCRLASLALPAPLTLSAEGVWHVVFFRGGAMLAAALPVRLALPDGRTIAPVLFPGSRARLR